MGGRAMSGTVGVWVMEHIAAGLVEGNKVIGQLKLFPESPQSLDPLQSMHSEEIVGAIRELVDKVGGAQKIEAIGIGFPGIIRSGVGEESPNLQQVKGFALQAALSASLKGKASSVPVRVFNDADAMAAGIAATHGKLHQLTRVWTLGNGIGFRPVSRERRGCGKAATPWSHWTRKRVSAAAAAKAISKEFLAAARCACASLISNRKKCLK